MTPASSKTSEFLENERKNSKNEINAKLNSNHNNNETGPASLEANALQKSGFFQVEHSPQQRPIRRIDLKAYGFEKNELTKSTENFKSTPRRTVNKLDLKSFGFENGTVLRRCQSSNQLDTSGPGTNKLLNNSKFNVEQNKRQSWNQTPKRVVQNGRSHFNDHQLNKLGSAVSVPDMSDSQMYDEDEICTSTSGDLTSRNNSIDFSESELDPRRNGSSTDDFSLSSEVIENDLTLPSVKMLAQAFNKSQENPPTPVVKVRCYKFILLFFMKTANCKKNKILLYLSHFLHFFLPKRVITN